MSQVISSLEIFRLKLCVHLSLLIHLYGYIIREGLLISATQSEYAVQDYTLRYFTSDVDAMRSK
jgi:hypothetical protein